MDKTIEPMTDDAELAKVLDSMQDSGVTPPPVPPADINFEETPLTPPPTDDPSVMPPVPDTNVSMPTPDVTPAEVNMPSPSVTTTDPGLESIKKDALEQLRPLVDKLDLPADERFDTLLLIIRSTDDKSLVQSAYDAAKSIENDAKRAEALLDIVKEIDYFSNPAAGQPQL